MRHCSVPPHRRRLRLWSVAARPLAASPYCATIVEEPAESSKTNAASQMPIYPLSVARKRPVT